MVADASKGMANMENTRLTWIQTLHTALLPNGELPLPDRMKIRRALQTGEEAEPDETRWCLLEIATARKVLPIWQASFPQVNFPIRLLDMAEHQLRLACPDPALEPLFREAKTFFDSSIAEDLLDAISAGFACWAAARNVLYGCQELVEISSELELDIEDWDASFFASCACSGGAVWEESRGNPVQRREFWLWYIAEARQLLDSPQL